MEPRPGDTRRHITAARFTPRRLGWMPGAGLAFAVLITSAALGAIVAEPETSPTPRRPGDAGVFPGPSEAAATTLGAWTSLPPPPMAVAMRQAVWTGDRVVVAGFAEPLGMSRENLQPLVVAALDPVRRRWQRLPPSGLTGWQPAVVAAGTRLLVWGGLSLNDPDAPDGAAFDYSTRSWQPIPPAPIPPRAYPAAVWTGREMVVWSGVDRNAQRLPDGAAYNPSTGAWRRLPDAPPHTVVGLPSATWTGREVLMWTGANALLYDPVEDRWRRLMDPPLADTGGLAAALGSEFVIMGIDAAGRDGVGLKYSPQGAWTDVAPPAGQLRLPTGSFVVTSLNEEMLVLLPSGQDGPAHDLGPLLWHAPASAWLSLPDAQPPADGLALAAAWTGSELVAITGRPGSGDVEAAASWRP